MHPEQPEIVEVRGLYFSPPLCFGEGKMATIVCVPQILKLHEMWIWEIG